MLAVQSDEPEKARFQQYLSCFSSSKVVLVLGTRRAQLILIVKAKVTAALMMKVLMLKERRKNAEIIL